MKICEMSQIVNLLYDEWDLGKKASQSRGKICAWIYLFEILEEAERVLIVKNSKRVIGMCGYSKRNSKKNILKKKIYSILKKILMHSPLIKNKDEIYKYFNYYNYLPEEMENLFDGEILILILDKKYRGKNIGKKLLMNTFQLAFKDNMKNLKILTDESCNFIIYEKLGCNKVFETYIPNREQQKCGNGAFERGYVYEKKLNEIL